MSSFKEDAFAIFEDLGSAWIVTSAVVLGLSILFRTWILFGAIAGALLTLYIHPFDAKSSARLHAYSSSSSSLECSAIDAQNPAGEDGISPDIPLRLRTEMNIFSAKIIRDYVRWWYQPPNFPVDNTFPSECQSSLNCLLNNLYFAVIRKDPILYLDAIFTSNVATIGVVLEDLRESYKLKSESDPIGLTRFTMMYPESPLARMTNKEERKTNLQRRADDLIKTFAKQSDVQSGPVLMFMRQIVAVSVFEAALRNLANKDSLNASIVASLTDRPVDCAPPADSTKTQIAAALTGTPLEFAGSTDSSAFETAVDVLDEELVNGKNVMETPSRSQTDTGSPSNLNTRGRRLSFKSHSVSSVADFGSTEDPMAERRNSFLKRTGSLLSKSRSRSNSPSKENQGKAKTSSPERHSRSRSISPFKKSVKAATLAEVPDQAVASQKSTLFQAELIVNDISEISPKQFNQTVLKMALPKFSILISPVKQEGYGSSAGIGVFRSILDIGELDVKLRAAASQENTPGLYQLTEWRQLTYAQLENQVLAYLTSVTRLRSFAEQEVFTEFCRSDLVSEDRRDDRADSWALADGGKALLGTLRKGTALVRPSFQTTPGKEPVKRGSLDEGTRSPVQKKETTETKSMDAAAHSSGVDLDRIDFQNLVSQSMELLTAFFSLSSRTWTIRKQLLNLLRNLLLSKNSIYSHAFLQWLDTTIFLPISSTDSVADLLHQFNAFMFPEAYVKPDALTPAQSESLAKEARAIFIQKGMPSGIRNLMGVNPTNESLGIVFDALQETEFSMGLISILFSEAFKIFLVN